MLSLLSPLYELRQFLTIHFQACTWDKAQRMLIDTLCCAK